MPTSATRSEIKPVIEELLEEGTASTLELYWECDEQVGPVDIAVMIQTLNDWDEVRKIGEREWEYDPN